MSVSTEDEIQFDDDEIVADSDPLYRPGRPGPRDIAARLLARWKSWPLWARIVSVPAAFYIGIIMLTVVLGGLAGMVGIGGNNDPVAPPAASTATTLSPDTTDALIGLPALSPIAAAVIKPADRAEFRNKLNSVLADGTSICDVFFGVVLEQQPDGSMKSRWSITTPGMQKRGGDGMYLPSSQWPVRAFYGDANTCNVVAKDVSLVPPVTTVTTAAAVTTTTVS